MRHQRHLFSIPFLLACPAFSAVTQLVEQDPSGPTAVKPPAISENNDNSIDIKPADGNPIAGAIDAYNKGEHKAAVKIAKPLAKDGNTDALLLMGVAYSTGSGIEASRELAIESFRGAIKSGNNEASYRLAQLLINTGEEGQKEAKSILVKLSTEDKGEAALILGEGALQGWLEGEPNFEKARHWWKQAANEGNEIAILGLARLLDGEFGFPDQRDSAASFELYKKAANLGNGVGMVAVGSRFLNGEESIRDEKKGREWLAKAIEKGQIAGYLAIGDFEEQTKKDDKKAFSNYKKGAEAGQPGCMIKLGSFLAEGRGGKEKKPDEALEWFKKAGEAGLPLGHVQAAAILLQGEGLKIVEGYSHLVAAAESGLVDVQNEVGLLYLSGRLGIRDATAAAGWFSRSATGRYPQGAHNLGILYEQGLGVPQNFDNAGRLYTQAANAGHAEATSGLGRLHAAGLGTEQDLPRAWAFFSLAVKRDDEAAKAPLGELTALLTEEQVTEGRKILAELSEKKSPDEKKPAAE